jgi:hypothetical protein
MRLPMSARVRGQDRPGQPRNLLPCTFRHHVEVLGPLLGERFRCRRAARVPFCQAKNSRLPRDRLARDHGEMMR